ncbi:MAG: thiamine ABC transporter substrate-binding protein [Anaerolineaceae bacterium]
MKTNHSSLLLLVVAVLSLSACGTASATTVPAPTVQPSTVSATEPTTQPATATSQPTTLTVMVHDSFAASDSVINAFEQANNVKINFIKGGDAGAELNRVILAGDTYMADVYYGVDNTFLSRALAANIVQPYQSPLLANIPDEFKLDPQNRLLPVDYGDVCINYDIAYFTQHNLPLPQTLEDLTKPEYKDLLVVENPATSSPGLAFVLATEKHFGDPNFIGYWKDLRQNGLVVVNDWETAYYTNFSGSSGKGAQPMVVSYASSPVAEVIFATPPKTEAVTGSLTDTDMCFRQIEFVGVMKNAQNVALAQKFVDFMLSTTFQNDMPLQMFVYPVNTDAKIPDDFVKYNPVPAAPVRMDPQTIADNRDAWIQSWTEAVLH